MSLNYFSHKTYFHQVKQDSIYTWHTRPGAFSRLNPPWVNSSLLKPHPGVHENAKVYLKTKIGPFPASWIIQHTNVQPPGQFVDNMLQGPFKSWRHDHFFQALPLGTEYKDTIHYELPFSSITDFFFNNLLQHFLQRMFLYRHEIVYRDLTLPWLKDLYLKNTPHHILIVGGSGFIGKALTSFLQTQGHRVSILCRSNSNSQQLIKSQTSADQIIFWDPLSGLLPLELLEGIDAVVNLAGEPLAQRWNSQVKDKIWKSRVQLTDFLCKTLCKLQNPPAVFIQASGISYYGNSNKHGACSINPSDNQISNIEGFTEKDNCGDTFLAKLSEAWEKATDSLNTKGIRVVKLRMPAVLSPEGGALEKLLISYSIGFSGCWRPGCHTMPWISRDDLLDVIYFSILNINVEGPINAVAPHTPTNADFADTFATAINSKLRLRVPSKLVNVLLGEVAEELFYTNIHASPSKLLNYGFQFRYPKLKNFVKHLHYKCS